MKYTADHLRLPYDWAAVDVTRGESRTPEFLAMSPMGQVPMVEFDDGRVLAQSNAIIRYLARGSALLPDDPFMQAKVDEWLFWEQNGHEFFVAGCRFQMVYLGKSKDEREPCASRAASRRSISWTGRWKDGDYLVGDDRHGRRHRAAGLHAAGGRRRI